MPAREKVVQTPPWPGAILIVDDDNDVRSALAELLEEEGFSVEGAPNGREALACCAAAPSTPR